MNKQLFLSSVNRSTPHLWAMVYHTRELSLETEFVASPPRFFKTKAGAEKWFRLRYKEADFIEPEAVQVEIVSRIEEPVVKNMKAIDIAIGAYVKSKDHTLSERFARVISNSSRQGDEEVILEWDDDYTVSVFNVNDLKVLGF